MFAGLLLFSYSLFKIISASLKFEKNLQNQIIKIIEGSVKSKIVFDAKKIFIHGNIAEADETNITLPAENIGELKISAQKSVYNLKKNIIELYGSVKVKGEKIYAEVERAKVILSENGKKITKIEGEGNVFIRYEEKEINSETVEIIPEKNEIILKGETEIRSGNLKVKGEIVKINLKTNNVEIEKPDAVIRNER